MNGSNVGTGKHDRCREVAVVERGPLVEVRLYNKDKLSYVKLKVGFHFGKCWSHSYRGLGQQFLIAIHACCSPSDEALAHQKYPTPHAGVVHQCLGQYLQKQVHGNYFFL